MNYLFVSILLGCFFISENLNALPEQIILIRHAEKSSQGTALSTKGKERAAALAPYFSETENLIANGLPVAIYAMASPKNDSSQHASQTVTPLNDQLKLTIKDKFDKESYKKMVEEIKSDASYHGKTVLICWDGALIPEIARAFGALQTPSRWPSESYDRTWIITFSPNGRASFQNLPQRLMYGDSAN